MCGIVGYIGGKKAIDFLLDGLTKLEYRGYDSAGVAVNCGDNIFVEKAVGRLDSLKEKLKNNLPVGTIGIGHTRWATHGRPSDTNAHPHSDCHGNFFVVHNGIIENYLKLKEDLIAKGHKFISETDTEVVAHLLEECYHGDLFSAIKAAVGSDEIANLIIKNYHGDILRAISDSKIDSLDAEKIADSIKQNLRDDLFNAIKAAVGSDEIANLIIKNYHGDILRAISDSKIDSLDAEKIADSIKQNLQDDFLLAVREVISKIEGSYSLVFMSKDNPDVLICAKQDNPLVVGLGKDGENFIASDIPAIISYTRKTYILGDGEIAIVKKDAVQFVNRQGVPINKKIFNVTWNAAAAEKGGYEHFMLKEIHEQPKAVRDTISPHIKNNSIQFEELNWKPEELKNINKIYIVACGTAYHAGLVGKFYIEKLVRKLVEVDLASEFRYRSPIVDENTLVIVVSQSGETSDTLAALKESKRLGAKTLAVTNVVGSSIAREAEFVIHTAAGPEIAVASTKAYTTQLILMFMLALYMAQISKTVSDAEAEKLIEQLKKIPAQISETLSDVEPIKKFALDYGFNDDVFYIGRSLDYCVALEGALKLKEISYIHAEAYAAGELKHGTLALIVEGVPVIALATQKSVYDKTLSNIKEVKARDAVVIGIAAQGDSELEKYLDHVIFVPDTAELLIPILTVVPLQLLAYYAAITRGCDVDKPRNLAKSVTVE